MKRNYKLHFITIFFIVISSLQSQEQVPSYEITPVENALHGFATSVSESWALVSSPQKDINSKQSIGSVVFYQLTDGEWAFFQEVSPEELEEFASFGMSLDIDGTTAVISCFGDHEIGLFSGAVYVYQFDDQEKIWILETKLKASDSSIGTNFGNSVSINNDLIAIGAHNAEGNEIKSGAVYVFEKLDSGWTETKKIVASNGKKNDYFGHEVDIIDENTISVGAYNADGKEERSGVVYIYQKSDANDWTTEIILSDPNGKSSDLFGYCLSGSTNEQTNILFLGAPGRNNNELQTGSVYLFSQIKGSNTWSLNYELTESSSGNNDHFGHSVSFNSNGNLFVGANRAAANNSTNAGKIYIYENISLDENSLNEGTEFSQTNSKNFEHFGTSISSDNENLIIASPFAVSDEKTNAGAVYFYRYESLNIDENNLENLYTVHQNIPNPFTSSTLISYNIRKAGNVKITLYDVNGKTISILRDDYQEFGNYSLSFRDIGLSPGIYFFEFTINDFKTTKKMIFY
tara:strand:+ start:19691 stop:21241 length:1551 start_codon:yes stop_codon:yes gene_type:complete